MAATRDAKSELMRVQDEAGLSFEQVVAEWKDVIAKGMSRMPVFLEEKAIFDAAVQDQGLPTLKQMMVDAKLISKADECELGKEDVKAKLQADFDKRYKVSKGMLEIQEDGVKPYEWAMRMVREKVCAPLPAAQAPPSTAGRGDEPHEGEHDEGADASKYMSFEAWRTRVLGEERAAFIAAEKDGAEAKLIDGHLTTVELADLVGKVQAEQIDTLSSVHVSFDPLASLQARFYLIEHNEYNGRCLGQACTHEPSYSIITAL